MRAKLNLLSAFAVGIVGGALVSACQTYDFEPVEPLALAQTTVGDVISARAAKPNLMLLLDTSGSMTLPVDRSDPDCITDNSSNPPRVCGDTNQPACNVNVCPTRWSDLQKAMEPFLNTSGKTARMGLTTYPATATGGQCGTSSSVKIPIPQVDDSDEAALQNTANQIKNAILGIPLSGQGGPSGGTPTSSSLRFVGGQADLQTKDREDFILLLTDGLPNCNSSNPNAGNATTCRCTQTSCGNYSPLVCLDKDASVRAIQDLQAQSGIRTIVIGFGAETASTDGLETLNAMAEAGGFERSCESDPNACGANDTCNPATKRCGKRFYPAANQAELSEALANIINRVGNQDPCLLRLDPAQQPTDPKYIVVYVNDQVMEPGADRWELTAEGVKFVGATCSRILSSTESNPIKLEARSLRAQ